MPRYEVDVESDSDSMSMQLTYAAGLGDPAVT
jgi:hypothetical protein